MIDLILETASSLPTTHIAVRQYGPFPVELTYYTLFDEAKQLAQQLSLYATPRVGVLLNRGVNQIIAVLGILLAGGVYVPLDPVNHPPDRIEYILRDSSAVCIVTEKSVGAIAKSSQRSITQYT